MRKIILIVVLSAALVGCDEEETEECKEGYVNCSYACEVAREPLLETCIECAEEEEAYQGARQCESYWGYDYCIRSEIIDPDCKICRTDLQKCIDAKMEDCGQRPGQRILACAEIFYRMYCPDRLDDCKMMCDYGQFCY